MGGESLGIHGDGDGVIRSSFDGQPSLDAKIPNRAIDPVTGTVRPVETGDQQAAVTRPEQERGPSTPSQRSERWLAQRKGWFEDHFGENAWLNFAAGGNAMGILISLMRYQESGNEISAYGALAHAGIMLAALATAYLKNREYRGVMDEAEKGEEGPSEQVQAHAPERAPGDLEAMLGGQAQGPTQSVAPGQERVQG